MYNLPIVLYTISLSHFLYAFVWIFTPQYKNITRKMGIIPINFLIVCSYILKGVQFITIAYYLLSLEHFRFNTNERAMILSGGLFTVGQTLNLTVYFKLGNAGVYYGNRLGYETVWVTSFPYNYLENPQYIGSVLSILSLLFVIPIFETFVITCFWIWCYMMTSICENNYRITRIISKEYAIIKNKIEK